MRNTWIVLITVMVFFGCSKNNSLNVDSKHGYSVEQTVLVPFGPVHPDSARIYVVSDTISDVVSLSNNTHIPRDRWTWYRTIKGLHDEATRWDTSVFEINITYDPVHGYPSWLSIYPKPSSGLHDVSIAYRTRNYKECN